MNCNIVKTLGWVVSSFFFTAMQASGDEGTNLYYKVFDYGAHLQPLTPYSPPNNIDMKAELSSRSNDITWPPGSTAVRVICDTDYLVVRNTHQNLQRIVRTIHTETIIVRIVLESTIIAFKSKDIEDLQKGKGVSNDTLTELVRKGDSELISTARAITASGQEVTVRNARPLLYPDDPLAGSATNRADNTTVAVLPEHYSSCETGYIFSAVPERGEDGLINLTVKSEWISLQKWEQHEALFSVHGSTRAISVKKPVLDSSVVETQLKMAAGETVLLGGGKSTSDGRIMYHFLKAEVTIPERVQQNSLPNANTRR